MALDAYASLVAQHAAEGAHGVVDAAGLPVYDGLSLEGQLGYLFLAQVGVEQPLHGAHRGHAYRRGAAQPNGYGYHGPHLQVHARLDADVLHGHPGGDVEGGQVPAPPRLPPHRMVDVAIEVAREP